MSFSLLMFRAVAPLVWRSETKIAAKLQEFAATEAGSALDMLKAAELTDDPKLRQLFFRHAMDEARHARLFRESALQVAGDGRPIASEYSLIHAARQNLFETLGLVRFIAFVHMSEVRGELQFRALRQHFKDRPQLEALFAQISQEERFHVSYSARLLQKWREQGRRSTVRGAIWHVHFTRALRAWTRSGRILGDAINRVLLSIIYLTVLPLFVLVSRFADPPRPGWKARATSGDPNTLARRQY